MKDVSISDFMFTKLLMDVIILYRIKGVAKHGYYDWRNQRQFTENTGLFSRK